jgi:hypothetical protein
MSSFDTLYNQVFGETFPAIMGGTVDYTRGDDTTSMIAMSNNIAAETRLEYGVALTISAREYLIAVEDLTIDGEATQPQRNDQITENINGVDTIFEVANVGQLPAWEYDQTDRSYYLIRTIEVAE